MNTFQTIRFVLDRMLANVREELLQTQAGRAFLDEAPEPIRRSLKQATWTLR